MPGLTRISLLDLIREVALPRFARGQCTTLALNLPDSPPRCNSVCPDTYEVLCAVLRAYQGSEGTSVSKSPLRRSWGCFLDVLGVFGGFRPPDLARTAGGWRSGPGRPEGAAPRVRVRARVPSLPIYSCSTTILVLVFVKESASITKRGLEGVRGRKGERRPFRPLAGVSALAQRKMAAWRLSHAASPGPWSGCPSGGGTGWPTETFGWSHSWGLSAHSRTRC